MGFNAVSINYIHTVDSTIYISGNIFDVAHRQLGDSVWNTSGQKMKVGKIVSTDSCLYAYGHNAYYRSYNNGESWENINYGIWQNSKLFTIGNTLILCTPGDGDILKSDNNGNTFDILTEQSDYAENIFIGDSSIYIEYNDSINKIDINGNLLMTLSTDGISSYGIKGFVVHNESYYVISYFTLYKYNIEANYWFPFESGLEDVYAYRKLYNLNDTLYCTSSIGVFYLNNQTWININEGLNNLAVFNMNSIGSILLCNTLNNLYQKLPGQQWENITGQINYLDVNSIGFYQDEVWCTSYFGLFKSEDGGENFDEYIDPEFEQCFDIIITDSVFYLSTENGFFISNDYGNNWIRKCTDITGNGEISLGKDYCFYLEQRKGLYRIAYGSYEYLHLNIGEENYGYQDVKAIDSMVIVDYDEKIYISNNNGNSFNDTIYTSFSCIEKHNNWFYATIPFNGIQRSTDGLNWDYYDFENNGWTIRSIAFSKEKVLLAGGHVSITLDDLVVQMTDYEFDNWDNISGDLPIPYLPDVGLIATHDGRVFASPDEKGLYYRDDLIVGNNDIKYKYNEEFTTYPNPVTETLTIKCNSNNNTIQIIEIYTLIGEKILTQNINSKKTCLDISSLHKGIYLIRIISDDKEKTKKIIKL